MPSSINRDGSRNLGYIIHESKEPVKEFNIVSDKGNKIVAEGYLQTELDKKNRNGRIYGVPGIKKEIEGKRLQELIHSGNLKGEDGHPTDQSLAVQQTINPKYVSVKYLTVGIEGDNVKSTFCGTNTPYGIAFNEDLKDGELPSFSLRALGSVVTKGGIVYVENVRVVTWDRVYFPSHEKAYTTGVVRENAVISMRENANGILIPVAEESMKSFIRSESANIKTIMESFDIFFESMQVINSGKDVQLVTKDGYTMIVNLESHVQDQIMDYCVDKYI